MSLKNGQNRGAMKNTKSFKERFKDVWQVKEFRFGLILLGCMIAVFVLMLLDIL